MVQQCRPLETLCEVHCVLSQAMAARAVLCVAALQALAVAQCPWLAAGSSRGALKKIEELLTARTDLRITGA